MSKASVQRAAANGVGLLFESLSTPERCRELVDLYRDSGGSGPVLMIRRVWVGAPPTTRQAAQLEIYKGYAEPAAQVHWKGEQMIQGDTADSVAEQLVIAAHVAGADALNLRLHVPGVSPEEIHDQIRALADVVPTVHQGLAGQGLT